MDRIRVPQFTIEARRMVGKGMRYLASSFWASWALCMGKRGKRGRQVGDPDFLWVRTQGLQVWTGIQWGC
jgi:hypothetical protein